MDMLKKTMNKIFNSRHLAALSDALMMQLGLIVIGSLFLIVANPPINIDLVDYNNTNFFVRFFYDWKLWANDNYQILTMPYNFTMGIIGLVTAITIPYAMMKKFNVKSFVPVLISLSIYLLTSVIPLEEGYNITYLSTDGMFYAMFVGFIVFDLFRLLDNPKLKIKLDKSVPQNVADFINSLIPFMVILLIFYIPYVIVYSKTENVLPQYFLSLLSPSIDAISSIWGFGLLILISNLLWFFGINGLSIVFPILFTTVLSGTLTNADLVSAGQISTEPINIQMLRVALIGGSGNTIGLCILMIRSKVKKFSAVGKVSIIPSIFGINEPLIFGTPIILNPYLIVPFILTPIISIVLAYLGQVSGILTMSYLVDPPFIPFFMQSYLNSLSLINVLFSFVVVIISYFMYLPFFKAFERKEKEIENN